MDEPDQEDPKRDAADPDAEAAPRERKTTPYAPNNAGFTGEKGEMAPIMSAASANALSAHDVQEVQEADTDAPEDDDSEPAGPPPIAAPEPPIPAPSSETATEPPAAGAKPGTRPERRAHRRADLDNRFFFEHQGRFTPVEGLNISEGGVAGESRKAPPAIGTKVLTRFTVTPEERKPYWHEIPATIVDVEALGDGKWIVALTFTKLTEDATKDIRDHVTRFRRDVLRSHVRRGDSDTRGVNVGVAHKGRGRGRRR